MTTYDPFKAEIVELILQYLQNEQQNLDFDSVYNLISLPPDFSMGQGAFPCFTLAKIFKTAPPLLAQKLADFINIQNKIYVARAQVAGPYVNFHCNFDVLLNLEKNKSFDQSFLSPKKIENIIVEYSQPNTHKILHVGHLRCLVLGDALSNILEYVGHKVTRATYPGDIGTHVAKII